MHNFSVRQIVSALTLSGTMVTFALAMTSCDSLVEQPHVSSEDFAGVNFDHSTITKDCAQCHESERPARETHPQTGDCMDCHTYPDWAQIGASSSGGSGANFTHEPKPANCNSCHEEDRPSEVYSRAYPNQGPPANFNASDPKAPGSGHLIGGDCVSCHATPPEGAATFVWDHSNPKPTVCLPCHYNQGFAKHGSVGGTTYQLEGFGNCNDCHKNSDRSGTRNWKLGP